MGSYQYSGYDASGREEAGAIDAATESLAFEHLQSRGITVFALEPSSAEYIPTAVPWYRRDIRFRSSQLSAEDQAATADLLASLFSAGLALPEIIRITASSAGRTEVRMQFERIGQKVAEGGSFAVAFEQENKGFAPIFVSFLKVSEASNALPTLLRSLSSFLSKQNQVRQKVLSALIYPLILVLASLGLFLIVTLYLAPNLEPLFAAAGQEPPGTLSALLALNDFLVRFWMWLLLALAGGVLAIASLLQHERSQRLLARMKFRLPVFGTITRLFTLSQLAQAIELLLTSGMPQSEAFRQASASLGASSGFHGTFLEAADAVESGLTATGPIDADPHIPAGFKELFRVGEETNRLPSTLAALSETMSAQADRQTQRLLGLLTPVLTLVIGSGIGFLIYTLMGAILEINEIAF
ncbi:type II secretion system F family protein [Leisingera sp. ANG-M7]|uniref:type II secretion system F family protein n=1 Tax=Leisingera sp. ANG-M7 TaxID=1577902 RepID=UPI00057E1F2C|nr:type II secretion system F family protein [Leisingera sp. ANG-M7]KIC34976.1 hypothetical protein RA26_20030 [Leisingera sp. ANG-M7]